MSCKCLYRLIIFMMITAFTICTLLSLITPLYTITYSDHDGDTFVFTVSLTKVDNKTTSTNGLTTTTQTKVGDLQCRQAKDFSLASFALTVASVITGGCNVFCSVVWIMAPCAFPLGAIVLALTLLAFACTFVPSALVAYVASTDLCHDNVTGAFMNKFETFHVQHGYILLLVAFIGLFVTVVLQIFGCACGCQLERSKGVKARDTTIEATDRSSTFTGSSRYQVSKMRTYSPKK
jgi:hypothetical protein